MIQIILTLAILLSGCGFCSDPKCDPNTVRCGNGYYAKTKAQCP